MNLLTKVLLGSLFSSVQGIQLNALNKVHGDSNKGDGPTAFDQEFLKLHNQMRTDPKSFIEELTAFNASFSGRQVKIEVDGNVETIQTSEGNKPVSELIDFLKV